MNNTDDINRVYDILEEFGFDGISKDIRIENMAHRIAELEQLSSYYHTAVNDIAMALGWRLGQAYEIQSMLKKIEELKLHKRANLAKQGHVVPHDIAMQQVRTNINTTCNHMWYTDNFGPTRCSRCGISSTEA